MLSLLYPFLLFQECLLRVYHSCNHFPAHDLPGRLVGDQNWIDAFLLFLQITNVQVKLGFLLP